MWDLFFPITKPNCFGWEAISYRFRKNCYQQLLVFSNSQATLSTEAKDLELLWRDSEQGDFKTGGSSSRWVSIWSGTALSYGNLTTLLLRPGEKTWVCILWLTNNVTWTITQASDFGRMNVSKRAYIKNLAKEEPMRHKVSVVQTEVTCIDILGSPTRPTQGHLKKLVEAQGAQPAPPKTLPCPTQPRVFWQQSILFQVPNKVHLKPLCNC